MNKYKEAFNRIYYNLLFHGSFLTNDKCGEDLATLDELVEKATPKKPDYEGDGYWNGELVYDTWICPCCEERYEVDYDKYDYCPNCGQSLDWGEENE